MMSEQRTTSGANRCERMSGWSYGQFHVTRFVVVVFTLLTVATPTMAQNQAPSFKTEITIFSAAAAADWISTAHFMSYGVPEHFPLHAGWKHNTVAVISVGAAVDVASILIAKKIGKRHPKLARVAFYSAAAMRFYVAFDNERDLRRDFSGSNCVKRCF